MRTQTSSHTKFKQRLCSFVALSAVLANAMAPSVAFAESAKETARTPIKHVIYIIGENRSFDHVFATYQPVNAKEKVLNLLSEGIVQGNGLPGPNYSKAAQAQASVTTTYQSAPGQKSLYSVLPPALTGGPSSPYICQGVGDTGESCVTAANVALAQTLETGLPNDYAQYLLTGGTGQASHVPDARVSYAGQDASHLPNGPYQLTNANYPYDSYAASPVHRLFQMWQQLDCSADAAQKNHDFGCRMDLFPWVEVTVGAGKNGAARPANYSDTTTGEGSTQGCSVL
ncbi:hypothetical protein [Rhodoblastus sp.]|uniref:hypothetical protein n=1 Tax=Rhodoblastus sp. TaxID=1962975 RepID=UPI002617A33C|nr:hypothetical protein [Rhodoblastus sp.]